MKIFGGKMSTLKPLTRGVKATRLWAEVQNEVNIPEIMSDEESFIIEKIFIEKIKAIRPRPLRGNVNQRNRRPEDSWYIQKYLRDRENRGRYRIGSEETPIVSVFVDNNNEDNKFLRAACFHSGKKPILCY